MRKMKLALIGVWLVTLIVSTGCERKDEVVNPRTFMAILTGVNEVPAVTTSATGQLSLEINNDESELTFVLAVNGLNNVNAAHIHLGSSTANGEVVAWLYPATPPAVTIAGTTTGVLRREVLTNASLVGSLSGKTLHELITAIETGNAYANVHTDQNPGGEIRGQIL